MLAYGRSLKIRKGRSIDGSSERMFRRDYRIPVKDMRDIHSTGHFLALGGQGNDIDVVLADETEFGKWMDKQSAKVYYQSGKTTSGDIDVKLSPLTNTYYRLAARRKIRQRRPRR